MKRRHFLLFFVIQVEKDSSKWTEKMINVDYRFVLSMKIIFIFFTLITFIFALIILLLLVIFWKRKFRSISNLFICNSSISLLFYVIAISLEIENLFENGDVLTEDFYCKFRAFLLCFACAVKSLSYLIQAISRWFIIIYSQHPLLRTYRIHFLMILSTWLISFVVCSSLILFPRAYQYERESQFCVLSTKSFLTSFIPYSILFFVPLIFIVVLYGKILWKTTLLKGNQTNDLAKVYRTLLTLIVIVLIGGIPYFLSAILNRTGNGPWWLFSISIAFISFEAMLEALVLFFYHEPLKEQCYQIIFFRCFSTSNEILPI